MCSGRCYWFPCTLFGVARGRTPRFFIIHSNPAARVRPGSRLKEKQNNGSNICDDHVHPAPRPHPGPPGGRDRDGSGGIIIPDSAKEKPQEGEVISVGKGKSNDEGKVFPLDVKAGDRVLFGKYSGTEIKIDGEEFLIMREEEVLGIIKK